MAKALVTGGTGFIGSHIVGALLQAGHTVRVLHRPSSDLELIAGLPIEHALGDVLDPASLARAMPGCDWVFHTAAVADYWRADRIKMYIVNVQGTREVLRAAREAGVRRVMLTSSAAAVGLRDDGLPSTELLLFNQNPGHFPYGHSKSLAEREAFRAAEGGQEVVILNPTVVFGPGDKNIISGSMVVEAARGVVPPLYPPGSVTVVDVRDVAQAHLAAAERGRPGERYLLGAADVSYRELWGIIARVVGIRAPIFTFPASIAPLLSGGARLLRGVGFPLPVDADQVRLSARPVCFDTHKARAELSEPGISVEQSIRDTYQWYVERGVLTARG